MTATKQQTEALIRQLAADAPSVRKIRCVVQQSALSLLAAAVLVWTWLQIQAVKPGMWEIMPMHILYIQFMLAGVLAFTSATSLFWHTLRAGTLLQKASNIMAGAAFGSLVVLICWQLVRFFHMPGIMWFYGGWSECALSIILCTILLGSASLYFVRRAGILNPVRAAIMAGLFGGSVGMIARMIICPLNDPWQMLSIHVAPVLLATLLIALFSRRFLSW